MSKIKSALIGIIIVLLIFPGPSHALDDEYAIERSPWTQSQQPSTLNDAINEIKQMIADGRPRWEIAKRVATIADVQIKNVNDPERMEVSWKHWMPLSLAGDSEEEKDFADWRDVKRGGDAQYDKAAEWVWDSRYGQCAENSALVYYILKKAGAKNVCIFGQGIIDHAFVVWGMDEEADPGKPESWTDDVIVPDSWSHFVLKGQKAFNNRLHGGGGKGVADNTYMKDSSVQPRCGFYLPLPLRAPCCKKVAPCRDDPKLACFEGKCVPCGSINMPCCVNEKCNFETLECKDNKCIKKTEEKPVYIPPECIGKTTRQDKANCTFELSKKRPFYLSTCYNITDQELKDWCIYWYVYLDARERGYLCDNIVDEEIKKWCKGG